MLFANVCEGFDRSFGGILGMAFFWAFWPLLCVLCVWWVRAPCLAQDLGNFGVPPAGHALLSVGAVPL